MGKKTVQTATVATIRLAGAPAPMQEREFKHRADAERWLKQQREIAERRGWGGYQFELTDHPSIVRSGHSTKKSPAQLDREINAVLQNYRVAYALVTRRDGKIVTVRSIVDAPRALTLAEAEKWRRKFGRSSTAWIETMAGEFVPVTGARRLPKFVDDARPGDVHALLTSPRP